MIVYFELLKNFFQIWDDIKSEAVIKDPKLLNRFFLLTFSVRVQHIFVLLHIKMG